MRPRRGVRRHHPQARLHRHDEPIVHFETNELMSTRTELGREARVARVGKVFDQLDWAARQQAMRHWRKAACQCGCGESARGPSMRRHLCHGRFKEHHTHLLVGVV